MQVKAYGVSGLCWLGLCCFWFLQKFELYWFNMLVFVFGWTTGLCRLWPGLLLDKFLFRLQAGWALLVCCEYTGLLVWYKFRLGRFELVGFRHV